ncbi:hypothetical protein BP00DRAFT_191497 [Aspergillus indologenus CBS 114.80]|uniref:Uncharacterized protein n=1 Tax=Aspergillus indologenus CBS 114.80 TaxID=1450541 RepID=A0A2V5I6L9_9EURO|nr:hypothetical protein BP00DRAFT_191497 [Aspergillus indologenus CBS 114.80]
MRDDFDSLCQYPNTDLLSKYGRYSVLTGRYVYLLPGSRPGISDMTSGVDYSYFPFPTSEHLAERLRGFVEPHKQWGHGAGDHRMGWTATNTSDHVIQRFLICYPRRVTQQSSTQTTHSSILRVFTIQHKRQIKGNAVFWYQLSTCSALLRCAMLVAHFLSDPTTRSIDPSVFYGKGESNYGKLTDTKQIPKQGNGKSPIHKKKRGSQIRSIKPLDGTCSRTKGMKVQSLSPIQVRCV